MISLLLVKPTSVCFPPDSWYRVNEHICTSHLHVRFLFHSARSPVEPSASITLGHPSHLAILYKEITEWCLSQPDPVIVHCRFRGFCLKQCVEIGILKMASAVCSLVAMTQPGYSELIGDREFRAIDSPIRGNGDSFLVAVYHSDGTSRLQWLARDVASGLLYPDAGVLSYLETERATCVHSCCLSRTGYDVIDGESFERFAKNGT
ncbi:uncharacterized protein Bfra_006122 [Botrytis fragariae]|uniref:Uncharacterized protein n=1 Tax=Botrytis fragariae TaxID=1964551 RepID=A0A8H6EHR0_9HELO|nr:uncharacterized protein Bfra_006122 [Botrytis fragariae]KAF5872759.1 hypothetical protein Bfra_006122 [Botrytis fragariae]